MGDSAENTTERSSAKFQAWICIFGLFRQSGETKQSKIKYCTFEVSFFKFSWAKQIKKLFLHHSHLDLITVEDGINNKGPATASGKGRLDRHISATYPCWYLRVLSCNIKVRPRSCWSYLPQHKAPLNKDGQNYFS